MFVYDYQKETSNETSATLSVLDSFVFEETEEYFFNNTIDLLSSWGMFHRFRNYKDSPAFQQLDSLLRKNSEFFKRSFVYMADETKEQIEEEITSLTTHNEEMDTSDLITIFENWDSFELSLFAVKSLYNLDVEEYSVKHLLGHLPQILFHFRDIYPYLDNAITYFNAEPPFGSLLWNAKGKWDVIKDRDLFI